VRLYVTRGGFDHITGAMAGMPIAVDWLSRRLAGRSTWSPGRDSEPGARARAA